MYSDDTVKRHILYADDTVKCIYCIQIALYADDTVMYTNCMQMIKLRG